jgi:hypothetical protein
MLRACQSGLSFASCTQGGARVGLWHATGRRTTATCDAAAALDAAPNGTAAAAAAAAAAAVECLVAATPTVPQQQRLQALLQACEWCIPKGFAAGMCTVTTAVH